MAFFEVKQKHNNVVNKRRTAIPLIDAYQYINRPDRNELVPLSGIESSNFKEIDHF